MTPNEPGYWWYRTKDGKEEIAEIESGFCNELCVIYSTKVTRVSVFECMSNFDEWIGRSYPPKRVQRLTVDDDGYERSDEFGKFILYEHMKEFVI